MALLRAPHETRHAIIVAIGLAAYVFVRWDSLSTDLRFGLLTACLVLISSALSSQQQIVLQTYQQFGRLTVVLLVTAAVNLVGGITGALIAGVRGVFVSQVVAFAVGAAVSLAVARLPHRQPLRAAFLLRMLKAGIPFALIMFVAYNLINVDQVMSAPCSAARRWASTRSCSTRAARWPCFPTRWPAPWGQGS